MLSSGQIEKGDTGEDQSQEHAHHFLWNQGDCSQIIYRVRPNSQFREDFAPNFGDKWPGCYITTTYHLKLPFTPGNSFYQKHDSSPHLPYFSLVSRCRHNEVSEPDSQAVLNTLTEHDFRDEFKKCQRRWKRCIHAEGIISRVMIAKTPRVSFWPNSTAVSEIMDMNYSFLNLFWLILWQWRQMLHGIKQIVYDF
jgi:hypothetical protein